MQSAWENLLHNPVPAIGVIVTVSVALLFHWWRQRKEFNYRLISDYPLFDVNKQFSDRVKILFDDKPVNRVSLVVIEFLNNGWQPIKVTDFNTSIEVSFGDKSEIMNFETVKKRPKDLTLNIIGLDSTLTIEPTLFNRGDFVQLKILVHDYKGSIDVNGRIENVPEIKRISSEFRPGIRGVFILFWLAATGFLLRVAEQEPTPLLAKIVAVGVMLFFALLLDYLMRNSRPIRLRIYDD